MLTKIKGMFYIQDMKLYPSERDMFEKGAFAEIIHHELRRIFSTSKPFKLKNIEAKKQHEKLTPFFPPFLFMNFFTPRSFFYFVTSSESSTE